MEGTGKIWKVLVLNLTDKIHLIWHFYNTKRLKLPSLWLQQTRNDPKKAYLMWIALDIRILLILIPEASSFWKSTVISCIKLFFDFWIYKIRIFSRFSIKSSDKESYTSSVNQTVKKRKIRKLYSFLGYLKTQFFLYASFSHRFNCRKYAINSPLILGTLTYQSLICMYILQQRK